MAAAVRYTVLGPLRVWRGGAELSLGPPKQQALLALLLVRAGAPLTVHEAVDALWDTDPPASALNVMHRHIGGLRRLLEPDLPSRAEGRHLLRAGDGYRLPVDEESLDLLRFRALHAAARRAAAGDEREQAAGLFLTALRLWRGPVAAGSAPQLLRHPVFLTVDNEYVAAAKEAADAVVPGVSAPVEEILAVLRRAAEDRPLDEALQARIILLLAAGGRQAEALERYAAVRSRLAEELGVDPSAELRTAHERVLRQTAGSPGPGHRTAPGDDVPADAVPEQSGAPPRSCPRLRHARLPVDTASFVGRRAELEQSQALLSREEGPYAPVVIGAVSGMAGVGKTTFAVHWAHLAADRFPDGQVYVDLRGFHPDLPPVTPADALRDLLDALGVPPSQVPDDPDALASLYRCTLADRRVLILLDNARDSDQVRPLLPGGPDCLTIITSRHRLHGLIVSHNARFIPLGLLTLREGVELLVRRLGEDRVRAELPSAEAIVELCGHLPLAVAIASARAVLQPSFPLAAIAAELRESRGRLDAFASRDTHTDARSVFSCSYKALSPAARRLFRLLSVHPATDFTAPVAAGLVGGPLRDVRPRIAELVDHHLLTEHVPGRFTCHELLRAYAAELCADRDSEQEQAGARRRMFAHYLGGARRAEALLAPFLDRRPVLAGPPGVTPPEFAGRPQAADWIRTERQTVLTVALAAARHTDEDAAYCWQLAQSLEFFLDRHGRWQDQHRVQNAALEAAIRTGDVRGQAHALRALGLAGCRTGDHGAAFRHLSRALDLFRDVGDQLGQGRTHRYAAFAANAVKDHPRALDHYDAAAACYAAAADPSGRATILNEIGWTHILMGDFESALVECGKAVAMHREIPHQGGEAAAWDSLGYAHHHLGRHEQALVAYGYALDLYRAIKDVSLEADTLVHIGDCHFATSDVRAAEDCWHQALLLFDHLGHPDAEQVRERLARSGTPVHVH